MRAVIRTSLGSDNADQVKEKIASKISKSWSSLTEEIRSIEQCSACIPSDEISLDESVSDINEAKKLSEEFKKIMSGLPEDRVKDTMLPLQGKNHWQAWAELDRKQHEEVNSDIAVIDGRKRSLRRTQFDIAEKPTPLMSTFLSQVLRCQRNVRAYYLQYLKLYLDDYSRRHIKRLNQQHEANLLQSSVNDHPKIKKEYYQNLSNASCGLEHFFREVSQVYEAAQCCNSSSDYHRLPQVAAELLIDGYPLELLDGEASHVPLVWVTAVLEEVIRILDDPQVFVLSVLGLQSSGKSTLLNTTFGLRFTVSAGRCTRGAFMQLLAISDKLRGEIDCDYVLVVDTEGLRAPELESNPQQRVKSDNKLATFVVGLANVTMINIYGEIPGEMDDILQTVIHAFIRMRCVKLKPSCQFVHQNVPSVLALGKGEMGRSLFRDKLDGVTKEIAQVEDCAEKFTCFNHVISFDIENDVHYFPGLWNGDLPMATINDGYCDKTVVLRERLIEAMSNKDNPLSSFKQRLEDLWRGLLHEDFVLSFRNSLEAIAFRLLEAEYGKWTWEFKDQLLTWIEQSKIEINNSENNRLDGVLTDLSKSLDALADRVQNDLNHKMKVFFEESKHKELLVHSLESTREKLDNLREALILDAKRQCEQAVRIKKANLDVEGIKSKYDGKITAEIGELAERLKETDSESLLRHFTLEWTRWMLELGDEIEPIGTFQVNIAREMVKALELGFPNERGRLNAKLRKKPLAAWGSCLRISIEKDFHYTLNESGWMSTANVLMNYQKTPESYYTNRLEFASNQVLETMSQYLQMEGRDGFYSILADKLIRTLKGRVYKMTQVEGNQKWMKHMTLTADFKLDMHLITCGYALHSFEQKSKDYMKRHDPVEYFKEKKDLYFKFFKALHSRAAADVAAASRFCDLMTKPIKEYVMLSLGPAIVNSMKSANQFLQTKSALKVQVLIDLAENLQKEGIFERHIVYFQNPEVSTYNWLRRSTVLHCNETEGRDMTNLVYLAHEKLSDICLLVGKKVKKVTNSSPKQDGLIDGNEWLSRFCSDYEMKRRLSLDFGALQRVSIFERLNAESFLKQVMEGLEALEIELQDECKSMDCSIIDTLPKVPYILLFESLQGCTELCPFCNEQCEREYKHSDNHSIAQHRPQCLAGTSMEVSDKMVMDICNVMVGSNKTFTTPRSQGRHQFLDYSKVFPEWFIKHDRSSEASSYWKWLLGNYSTPIAEHFGIKVSDIPATWKELKWEEVKESLVKYALPE